LKVCISMSQQKINKKIEPQLIKHLK